MSDHRLLALLRTTARVLIGLSLVTLWLSAQDIPPFNPPGGAYKPTKFLTFNQSVGLWRTDHSYDSTIRLSNQLATSPMDATVTLMMADGTPYALPPTHLLPSGVATVNVSDALAHAPASLIPHLSEYGSATITYRYDWQGVIYASVSILDIPRSLQYTYPFMFPMGTAMAGTNKEQMKQRTVMEALAWTYSDKSNYFLSFANTANRDITVHLSRFEDDHSEGHHHSFVVPAHNTILKTFSAREHNNSEIEDLGGVHIVFEGEQDELNIVGGVEDPVYGYSANIPVATIPADNSAKRTVFHAASTGIMVGKQDPMMGFPADLRFRPYAFFRNIGDHEIRLSASVHYGADHVTELPVHELILPPHTSKPLRFPSEITSVDGSVTLAFSYEGQPNSVLMATGSVDQTGNYVFAVEPRVAGKSASKSSVYWSTANGFDTMYSLWNPSDEPQDVVLKFMYAGGSYLYPVHIGPKATVMADIKDLMMMGMPDAKGRTMSPMAQEGSMVVMSKTGGEIDPINVVLSGGIFNPQTATCGNTCETCNGCTTFGTSLTPGQVTDLVSSSGWAYSQCPWYNGTIQTLNFGYTSWTSNNTPVLTVQNSSNPGLTYGVSQGSAAITAILSAPVNAGQICTQGTVPPCPTGGPNQAGTGQVAPTLAQINAAIQQYGLGNVITKVVYNGDGTYSLQMSTADFYDLYAGYQSTTCSCDQADQVLIYGSPLNTAIYVIKLGLTGILQQLGLMYRNPLPIQGQPNSNQTHNTPNGKVVRVYGPDGKATHDIDYGDQSHSGWNPEVHDWNWGGSKPVRQPPRQPQPGDFPPGVPTTWP